MSFLKGRSILLVEDEPLIALDVQECLEDSGATVYCAMTIPDAIRLVELDDLSAAVIDYYIKGEAGLPICERLTARGVPYVFHTGRDASEFSSWVRPVVSKPASCADIVDGLRALLQAET